MCGIAPLVKAALAGTDGLEQIVYIGLNDGYSGVGDGTGSTTVFRKRLQLVEPATNGDVTVHPFWEWFWRGVFHDRKTAVQ